MRRRSATHLSNMVLVENFYIKNYVFESQLFDDVRAFIEKYGHTWKHYRIEIEYDDGNLKSVHLISNLKGPNSVIKEKKTN